MLSLAVCDDEENFNRELCCRLETILKRLGEPFRMESYASANTLLQSQKAFDILLLDIKMPGQSGLSLAKQLRGRGTAGAVIFVTAFREYAFDAFSLEAVDYLCKPLQEERLEQALYRAMDRVKQRTEKSLLIASPSACRAVKLYTIRFCEVVGRKLYLHTDGETICYGGKLKALEQELDERFFCCHRSYLVNLDFLSEVAGGQAVLQTGERLPVSRLRQKELMQAMLRRLKGEVSR